MTRHDGFDGPGTRVGTLPVPADAPAELLDLLRTAAGPPTGDEVADEPAAVAAFVATRADLDATSAIPAPRARTHPARHSIRGTVAATISFLVLGGGLAAADVLPAPAQRWVSSTLDKIGISVPAPDSPQAIGTGSNIPGPTGIAGDAAAERPIAASFALPPGRPPHAPQSAPDARPRAASAESSEPAPEPAPDVATAASPRPGAPARTPSAVGNGDAGPGRSTAAPAPGSNSSSNSGHASSGNSAGDDSGAARAKPGNKPNDDKATPPKSSQSTSGRSAPGLAVRQETPAGVAEPGKGAQSNRGLAVGQPAGRGQR